MGTTEKKSESEDDKLDVDDEGLDGSSSGSLIGSFGKMISVGKHILRQPPTPRIPGDKPAPSSMYSSLPPFASTREASWEFHKFTHGWTIDRLTNLKKVVPFRFWNAARNVSN